MVVIRTSTICRWQRMMPSFARSGGAKLTVICPAGSAGPLPFNAWPTRSLASVTPTIAKASESGATAASPHALVPENDLGVQRDALVQVLNIVVDQANASGRNEVTNRLRRVGAMDEQPGLIEQQRSRSERIAR